MKTTFQICLIMLVATASLIASCKKDSATAPVKKASSLSPLSGSWYISEWGGVQNNGFSFSIDTTTMIGTVTQVSSQPFGYTIGDQFLISIVYNAPGRFNATGEYTYGTNNTTKSTRAAILTLQNNNTQLTIDYPAINADFQEITYVFQKGSVTNINL